MRENTQKTQQYYLITVTTELTYYGRKKQRNKKNTVSLTLEVDFQGS